MGLRAEHFSRIASVGVLLCLAAGLGTPAADAAKPDRLYPVAESYSPGDTATMVGYVDQATHGDQRALYIESHSFRSPAYPVGMTRIEVGTLEVAHVANRLQDAYRVSAEFVVPTSLEPGVYRLWYDLDHGPIGRLDTSKLRIGKEPKNPVRRAWALDEPEILNLAPDALIKVPGGTATATEIRTGTYFTDRAVVVSGALGTKNLRIESSPLDLPVAMVAIKIPETPLVVETVLVEYGSGSNAGWLLALAAVAFIVLVAADARDKRLTAMLRNEARD